MPDFIATLVERSMTEVFDDWQTMIDARFTVVGTRRVDVDGKSFVASARNRPTIVLETRVEGSCEGELYIGFTEAMVVNVVGPMVMLSPESMKEKETTGMDEMDREAFQEMGNLLCGSSNKVFQELGRDLRVSQSVDDLKLHSSRDTEDSSFLEGFPAGEVCCVQMLVEQEERRFPLLLCMSEQLAADIATLFIEGEEAA